MDQWRGKLAVVTGASSGIGAGIVAALLEHGVNVVGLARRLENMKALANRMKSAKGTFHPIACDLRKEPEILAAFQKVEKLGGADILVNNAGLAFVGKIVDSNTECMKNILDVNVLAGAICVREAIKSMRNRQVKGHVLFINSTLGHIPALLESPLNLYETSKCAVTGLSAILRREMRQLQIPIKVSVSNLIIFINISTRVQ
ncbi:farnesol dehydrogenase-like [Ceratina calcarata]|uniref:Farnesol dehydrogenase-like n=1 Tax=Ceratina calcarata TaxID=156304 RepID=A0AAJ7IUM7_9HYME|nr:farnesol dehydrogenase-like [Ceratina calcarata]